MGCAACRDGDIMKRHWRTIELVKPSANQCTVRVLHWNVLAQQLTENSFPKVSEEHLSWDHRSKLFEEEFNKRTGSGGYFWDVICIQECDKHVELFRNHPVFAGAIMPKDGRATNGIFYNTAKFTCKTEISERYRDRETREDASQGFMSMVLEEKATGADFLIYTTHLKAKPGFE